MIEGVTNNGILSIQKGFKQTRVGIKARGVKNGILKTQKFSKALLQMLVQGLRTADKTHRSHAKAMTI